MGRNSSTYWAHFLKYNGVEDGELKTMRNTAHYAWCKFCIEAAILESDSTATSQSQVSPFRALEKTHNAMRIVKSIRGVSEDMKKHLRSCPHNPTAENLDEPTLSQPRQPRPPRLPRQTVLSIETVGSAQQVKSPQQIKEWQHDILRLFVAMEARFNSANHPEVIAFFQKYFGRANPSAWILLNRLLSEEIQALDNHVAENI